MKLHLGCGQVYLKGYVNIDYPSSEHTVQHQSVADRLADISQLTFPLSSVEEVRLHHVFEHFRRPQISAMVACWNSWMVNDGVLHIEVPDLGRIARVFANPFSSIEARAVAERHLFGSHEAAWAAHYEGYDEKLMNFLLSTFGFQVTKIKRWRWRGTHNIHVFAKKVAPLESKEAATVAGKKFLSAFMVDKTPGELEMLNVWMEGFNKQLLSGWASG